MSRDRAPRGDVEADADLEAHLRAALTQDAGCPDVALWMDGGDGEDWRLAAHLASCRRCRDVLAGLASTPRPLPEGARGRGLLARARDIPMCGSEEAAASHEAPPALLRLVARVVDDVLEVLEASGGLLEARPVRGAADSGVAVERSVLGSSVRAHLSYGRASGFGILLDVQREAPHTGPIRVTLRRAARELRSETCDGGPVLFPGVRPGRYRLVLAADDGPIGDIELELEA